MQKIRQKNQQVWFWANNASGIVGSGSYDITIEWGSKDMSLEKYVLILQKNISPISVIMNFHIYGK